MASLKIPKSKIADIKKKYSDSKLDAIQEGLTESDQESLTLEEAKALAREQKMNETGLTPKEIRKNKKENLKKLRSTYSSERKVEAKWNFDVGDLVEFQDKKTNSKQIGIVVELELRENHSTTRSAKTAGTALILSSVGRVWKSPAALRKIE